MEKTNILENIEKYQNLGMYKYLTKEHIAYIKKWQNLGTFKNLTKDQLDVIYSVFDNWEDWNKIDLLLKIAELIIEKHKIK